MAKRTTASKKPTTKKPATKRPAAKKTTARKSPAKRTASKKAQATRQSFKVSPETQPFTSFRVTEQTVYWLIFTVAVLFLALWILKVNIQVQELYDQIDRNRITQTEIDNRYIKMQAEKRKNNN